ncbi:hypothetical protein BGZ60DRAFT_227554 [Tricladium varicosporioides]|nr:hypothetical protein BGZ60DRAFT_227554 [Hymenoscyphus varicosporioides]
MCGGGGKGNSPGPDEAIRLHTVDQGQSRRTESRRAPSRQGTKHGDRPPTNRHSDRPPSSKHTSQRPASSKRSERPPSSSHSKSRPKTSEVSSRRDSRPGSSSRKRPGSSQELSGRRHDDSRRGNFDTIHEDAVQYTDDEVIISRVSELRTAIDLHAENFYDLDGYGSSRNAELNDPRIRKAVIDRDIARAIITEIIMKKRNSSDIEIQNIATRLSVEFRDFAISQLNVQRERQLYDLCNIGVEIKSMMHSHPSIWDFGDWDDVRGGQRGYILVFPTLLQDEEQAAARKVIRI